MCPDKQLISVYFDGELPSPWKEKLESHISNCAECQKKQAAYKEISKLLSPSADDGMEAARNRVWNNLAETYGFAGSNAAAGPHNADTGAESAAKHQVAGNAASSAGTIPESGFNEPATGNRQPATDRGSRGRPRRLVQHSFWQKSVRVPLPAAAAILIFAAFFLLFRPAPPPSAPPPMPNAIAAEAAPLVEALPAADIEPLNFDALDFDAQAAGSMSTMTEILRYIEAGDSSNVVIIKLPEKKKYNRSGGPVILRAVDYAKNASGGGNTN